MCLHWSISIRLHRAIFLLIVRYREIIFFPHGEPMRLWMLHKHEKRRMRTMLQSGDKSHATWSKKKISFLSEKNLPRNGFRSFCTPRLRVSYARHTLFFSHQIASREKGRKERESEIRTYALTHIPQFSFPMRHHTAFRCCHFITKRKSFVFSHNFNYRDFIWHACSAYMWYTGIELRFSLETIHIH